MTAPSYAELRAQGGAALAEDMTRYHDLARWLYEHGVPTASGPTAEEFLTDAATTRILEAVAREREAAAAAARELEAAEHLAEVIPLPTTPAIATPTRGGRVSQLGA